MFNIVCFFNKNEKSTAIGDKLSNVIFFMRINF